MEKKVFFKGEYGNICGILNEIENSKEVVVICHGFTSHKNSSAQIFAELLESIGISSLRIDFDNRGESELQFKDITFTKYINQLNSAIEFSKNELNYEEISIIGTSFGGIVSLVVASQRNDIKRLFLRSPGVGTLYYEYTVYKNSENYKQFSLGAKVFYKGTDLIITQDLLDDILNYYPLSKLAEKISIPVGIVVGKEDSQIPYQDTISFSEKINDSTFTLIENAGHSLAVDGDFSESQQALVDFFKK